MTPCELVRTDANEKWGCAIIIHNPDNSNRFLVCKRAPEESEPNTWGLPGGKVEIGEKPKDAIVREVLEETGLKVKEYEYLGCFVEDGWLDYVFISSVYEGEIKLQPEECTAYRWITLEEADRGVMFHTMLDMYKFTTSTLQFYKDWKDMQLYREMEKARQQFEIKHP